MARATARSRGDIGCRRRGSGGGVDRRATGMLLPVRVVDERAPRCPSGLNKFDKLTKESGPLNVGEQPKVRGCS